jgi:hypothetical protein
MRTRLAVAPVLLLLGACSGSGGEGTHDAGPADAGDPIAVFGIALGDCYAYSASDTASNPPALGVAVEHDDTTSLWYLADGGSSSVKARTLVFRQSGTVKMTDYLYVDGHALLLLKRDVAGAEQLEYRPALTVAKVPLKDAAHLEQTGQVRGFGGGFDGGLEPYPLAVDVIAQTLATPSNPAGSPGFALSYAGSSNRLPTWSFVPGVGPVSLSVQFATDSNAPVYKLQGQKQLAAGDQTCGNAQ